MNSQFGDASPAVEAAALYPFNGTDPGIVIALRAAYRAGAEREGRDALSRQAPVPEDGEHDAPR